MVKRGSYAKGVAKRAEIIDAVLDVVAAKGYRGATVKELADAVGLSPNGLLRYFGSKDALFTEILHRRDERSLLEVGPQRDRLAAEYADRLLHTVTIDAAVPGLIRLLNRMSNEATEPSHAAHEFFRNRYEAIRETNAQLLAEAREAGRVPASVDPQIVSALIWAAIDGMYTQHLYDESIDVHKHITYLLKTLGIPLEGPQLTDDGHT